jgi:hypothetical protein
MANITQEQKKQISPAIKAVLKEYGMKGTIGIKNYTMLVVNLKAGELDLLGALQKYNDYRAKLHDQKSINVGGNEEVNHYWIVDQMNEIEENKIAQFYKKLINAMKSAGWYNKSDINTDYFDTAYYLSINVGRWDRDYVLQDKLSA